MSRYYDLLDCARKVILMERRLLDFLWRNLPMKINLLAGVAGVGLLFVSLAAAADDKAHSQPESDDVQRAIAFQHQKDQADARQERLERKHPSVSYDKADRSDDKDAAGHRAGDPGEAAVQRDKKK